MTLPGAGADGCVWSSLEMNGEVCHLETGSNDMVSAGGCYYPNDHDIMVTLAVYRYSSGESRNEIVWWIRGGSDD